MNNFGILFTIVTFTVVCITNSAAIAIDRDYHRLDGQRGKYDMNVINKLAQPLARQNGNQEDYLEDYDPDNNVEVFNRLARSYIRYNKYQDILNKLSKLNGLGLNPGYSAAQAAKIRMGILAAQNPHGPGRRRRSVDRENLFNSASSKAYDSPAEDRLLITMNNFGILFTVVTFAVVCITNSAANSNDRDYRPAGLEIEDPDYVMDLINKLGRSIIRQNEYQDFNKIKQGGRGYFSTEVLKALMGLSIAGNPVNQVWPRKPEGRKNHFNSASSKAYNSQAEDKQLEKIWR